VKTSELIASLSENLAPTRKAPVAAYLAGSLAAGVILSVALAIAWLGPRALPGDAELAFLFSKIMFALSVVGIGAVLAVRAAVPGAITPVNYLPAILPLVLVAVLGVLELTHVPRQHWHEQVFGTGWLACLFAIPLMAIAPYALMVGTMRRFAAPTDLVRAGAFAGMTAGGISALAYAVHCTDDSLSFVASWYVTAIAICTLGGALVGPRILRW
jgi:hypothetical protein